MKNRTTLPRFLFVLALPFLCSLTLASTNVKIAPSTGPNGTSAVLQTETSPSGTEGVGQTPSNSGRDFDLIWHRYLPDPIYTSVGLTGSHAFAGDYLNPPKQVEHILLNGDGTPDWVYPGTEFYVDASRYMGVLGALDANSADSTVTVMRWLADSTPLWRFTIHGCRPLSGDGWASGKGIQVDDMGSTIAVVVNKYEPGGLLGRLYVFDPNSPIPVVDYPLGGVATALAVSEAGQYIAIYAWPNIYVYDRVGGSLRWSGPAYSGNDAIAISSDGKYIAWGWSSLYLREWNGSTYQLLWATNKAGYYVTECAMAPGGGMMAVAWYASTFTESIIESFELPSHGLLWSYNYSGGSAARQDPVGESPGRSAVATGMGAPLLNPTDIISEMVFDGTGQYLAACSWGPTFPEIQVFNWGTPVLVFDTPGTMFDIDIWGAWDANTYVSACGKHVHAGTSGRGADLYTFILPGGMAVGEGPVSADLTSLSVRPNPARGERVIDFQLAGNGPILLTVHDPAGRLMAKLLDENGSMGARSTRWDGRDDAGKLLPAGSYFLTLRTGERSLSRRVIAIR